MEQKAPQRLNLLFGLRPKSTLINSLILITLSSLVWSLALCVKAGWNKEKLLEFSQEVSFMYDMPLMLLGWIMLSRLYDYWFQIREHGLGARLFVYKYFVILPLIIFYTMWLKIEFVQLMVGEL